MRPFILIVFKFLSIFNLKCCSFRHGKGKGWHSVGHNGGETSIHGDGGDGDDSGDGDGYIDDNCHSDGDGEGGNDDGDEGDDGDPFHSPNVTKK